jgi:transcriptional regulator with XRE-family HTH domain
MASCLSLSRSNVSQIESGKRRMREQVAIKLAGLQQYTTSALLPDIREKIMQQTAKDSKLLAAKVRTFKKQLTRTADKLDKMHAWERQCLATLRVISGLQENLPVGNEGEKHPQWLKRLKTKTLKKLSGCSTAVQLLLMVQMEGYDKQLMCTDPRIKTLSNIVKEKLDRKDSL